MPVLPVTKICSYGTRSRTRFSSFVGGRREVERGDPRDRLAVQLLRKRAQRQPCAQPGLDVHDRDPQVEGRDRRRESRRGVAVDEGRDGEAVVEDRLTGRNRRAGGVEALAKEAVEPRDHRRDELVEGEAGVADLEVEVGRDLAERQDRIDEVAVLARRDHDREEVRARTQRQDDREHLDRLGARPDQAEDVGRRPRFTARATRRSGGAAAHGGALRVLRRRG